MEIRRVKSYDVSLEFFCHSEPTHEGFTSECTMYLENCFEAVRSIRREYIEPTTESSSYDDLIFRLLLEYNDPRIGLNHMNFLNAYVEFVREDQRRIDGHQYMDLYAELVALPIFEGNPDEIGYDLGGLHNPDFWLCTIDGYTKELEEYRIDSWNERIIFIFRQWVKPESKHLQKHFMVHSSGRRLDYFKDLSLYFYEMKAKRDRYESQLSCEGAQE